MSIYRDHAHHDVHAVMLIKNSQVSERVPMRTTRREEDYKHLRKLAPANAVLPATLRWVASLPSEIRPVALLRQYPRIANLIAATWADSRALDTYMRSLMTDERGNRQGFPADVLRELGTLALQRSHEDLEKDTM